MLKAKAELDAEREEEQKKLLENRTPAELTKEEKQDYLRRAYELPEVVCVWVCNFPVPENSTATCDNWMLYSENDLKNGSLLPVTDRVKYIFIQLPNFNKSINELKPGEDQWIYVLKHAFASKAEIDIKNEAVTEALDRLKSNDNSEDTPMMTKKERDCIIASMEYDAERLREELVAKEAENAALKARNAELEAKLAAK